jgi:hypothetical protein
MLGERVTWRAAVPVLAICGVLATLLAAAQIRPASYPVAANGYPLAPDLALVLIGSRIVLDGDGPLLYDPERQVAEQRDLVPAATKRRFTVASPPGMLAMLPLAALPYAWAVPIWFVASVLMLGAAGLLLRPLLSVRIVHHGGRIALSVALSLPTFTLLAGGQQAALYLLISVVGLRLLMADRRWAAGAVFGLLVAKPQLALLLPLWFLATRRWRELAAWCVVAGSLALLSWATVGTSGLRDYAELLNSDAYQSGVAEDFAWKMLSLPARPC